MPKLGNFIRSLRTEKGLTQSALAEKLHVTDKAVSKWERDLSLPDISLLPTLADVLGVSVSDLLREEDDSRAPSRLAHMVQATHDIRTPLHIILSCAELAEMYSDDPEKRKRYLEAVRISCQLLLDRFEKAGKNSSRKEPLTEEVMSGYFNSGSAGQEKPAYNFRGKRILVAEDIALNQEIAREMILRTGAEAVLASDGEICLDMIERAPEGYYDLILMDVSMPNMDGIEATRRIRKLKNRKKAAIPIIAMTANAEEEDRKAAFEAGMNEYAEKPIYIEKLYAAMNQYLN